MNRRRAEREVVRLVLEVKGQRGNGEFPLDSPLGGSGVGLDSLKLVEFVLSFEKKFKVRVPSEVWDGKETVTTRYFIDLLAPR
jgi:acyl carrier protein